MIAIFDIGKTNKKLCVLDDDYSFVFETSVQIAETKDEDGDSCEDLENLTDWIRSGFSSVMALRDFDIKALNFSGYGASFVPVGTDHQPVAPLYNYLKPFPESLKHKFYQTYGGEEQLSLQTASPILGHLNSGLQLYRLKHQRPEIFSKIHYALHLPQFLSFLFTDTFCSDMTSIGCHTHLWDFGKNSYHPWVVQENIEPVLAPIVEDNFRLNILHSGRQLVTGSGLHDSSSALIPYLLTFTEPFVLISTGTWCISLNPFNQSPLTIEELKQDCLCYLSHKGLAVKAARLFAGHWHDAQAKRIASHFQTDPHFYKNVLYDTGQTNGIEKNTTGYKNLHEFFNVGKLQFEKTDLQQFHDHVDAYHQLMKEIVTLQIWSCNLILAGSNVNQIFVDGGFGSNPLYMHMLAQAYPDKKIFAASIPQASSVGAALILHNQWNKKPLPDHIVSLTRYTATEKLSS